MIQKEGGLIRVLNFNIIVLFRYDRQYNYFPVAEIFF